MLAPQICLNNHSAHREPAKRAAPPSDGERVQQITSLIKATCEPALQTAAGGSTTDYNTETTSDRHQQRSGTPEYRGQLQLDVRNSGNWQVFGRNIGFAHIRITIRTIGCMEQQ